MLPVLPSSTISDSLLSFRVLIARFRWFVFAAAFVGVLRLKDFLGYTDAVQIRLLAVVGVFALVAALDEYVLRSRGRRLRLGFHAVMLGDVAVPSAVLLVLPLRLVEYPIVFLAAVTITAIGLGAFGGMIAGGISSLAVLGIAGVRGEPLLQGTSLFWPVVFVAVGIAVGYAVERWDLGQRHLERASYWISKVSAAMTMAEIGDTVLDCLASAVGGPDASRREDVSRSFAGALLLLDQGGDRYHAVATRNLSAGEAARFVAVQRKFQAT